MLVLAQGISDLDHYSHYNLDEESGVRYDSSTSSAHDLSDINTVGYTTGVLGNAASFNGTNEYLEIASAPIVTGKLS